MSNDLKNGVSMQIYRLEAELTSLREQLASERALAQTRVTYYEDKLESMQRTLDSWYNDLQKERALRKELVDILKRIKPLAEDGHAMHKRNGCHQEFLSEDIERLQIVESLLHKSKPLDEKK